MRYRVTTFAVLLVLLFAGCKRSPLAQTNRPAASKLSTADISKLQWIEGTWRGSGVDQASFFERYRFETDGNKPARERVYNMERIQGK